MKKKISIILASLVAISLLGLSGCGKKADGGEIVVGATAKPHAEILEQAKSVLEDEGYTLKIVEFTDYVQPNTALSDKELDANFFQHKPYLDSFNDEHKTDLVSVAAIHYEPLGIYPGKTKDIKSIKNGAVIGVPNDTTNEARALLLLQDNGIITLKKGAGLNATANDITKNPKNVKIKELEAAQIARSLKDMDLAVINGNYAMEADLSVKDDSLASETADSEAAKTYANIVAVRKGDEKTDKTNALIKALKSDKVKKFIEKNYDGSVVPMF